MSLNVFQKNELKSLVDQVADLFNDASDTLGLPEDSGNAVRMELAMFMMYLSASDGEIKWEEADIINNLCNVSLTPQQLGDFIREHNIYSTEFEQKAPVTFSLMVNIDNVLYNKDPNSTDAVGLMLQLYELIGQSLISADDDVDDNEKRDYGIFINMLKRYADENSTRRKRSATGFTKDIGSVTAPVKSGVSAPRKR